ncbi:13589_t:CDS:1, partial [Cetraspora pellucida]
SKDQNHKEEFNNKDSKKDIDLYDNQDLQDEIEENKALQPKKRKRKTTCY